MSETKPSVTGYQLYNGQDPFTYHQPTQIQVAEIEAVRNACRDLYEVILDNVPAGAERTLAIRKLEEVSMWANKAIVFEQVS